MTPENDNFDKILEQLVASTRSPRGRFSAKTVGKYWKGVSLLPVEK